MALRAVPDHPKFAELKAALGLSKGATLGYLECVWHFVGRFTPQGNIGKYTDTAIESWVEWEGAPGALIDALIAARWIDRDSKHRLLIHDWPIHADRAAKQALIRSKLEFCVPTVDTESQVDRTCVTYVSPTEESASSTMPLPVPESVPESGAESFPEGLPPGVYAVGILEHCCLPVTPYLLRTCASAIAPLGKLEKIPPHEAGELLEKRILAAQARGDTIDAFWFQDSKWKGEHAGTQGNSAKARVERNVNSFAAAAQRSGDYGVRPVTDADGSPLPPSGTGGDDSGCVPGSVPGVGTAARRSDAGASIRGSPVKAGPEVLSPPHGSRGGA